MNQSFGVEYFLDRTKPSQVIQSDDQEQPPAMTPIVFAEQVFAVNRAILNLLVEASVPAIEDETLSPNDWPKLCVIARRVAEDLIFCARLDLALVRLKGDLPTALAVFRLTQGVSTNDTILTMRRAQLSTLHKPTRLPLYAYCSFLIELCDRLESGV